MSPVAADCASGTSGEGDTDVVAGGAAVVAVGLDVVFDDCIDPPQPGRSAAARTNGSACLTTAHAPLLPLTPA